MRKIPLMLALLCAPTALFATSPKPPVLSCSFETECIDGACETSGYTAAVTLGKAQRIDDHTTMIGGLLEDDAETVALSGLILDGQKRLFSIDNPAGARLLTIWADGSARYVTHITDPAMAVSYLGRCEETN